MEGSLSVPWQALMAQLPLPECGKMPQAFLDPGPLHPLAEGPEQPPGQPPCQVGAEPVAGQWRQRTKPSDLAAWRPGLELASNPELPLGKKNSTNGEQKARVGTFPPPLPPSTGVSTRWQLGEPWPVTTPGPPNPGCLGWAALYGMEIPQASPCLSFSGRKVRVRHQTLALRTM